MPDAAPRHALTLMVALDVSASMGASDIASDRLTRARLELADLGRRLHGERLGLIVYAGRAGVLLPPSDDPALFSRALEQVGPDLFEAPGSDAAAASLAGEKARAVLLLSDAETPSAEVTRPLVQAGIPLYVLSLASPAGAAIPLPEGGYAEEDGVQVISRPDAAAWRALARASGGRYAAVEDGDGDWNALYDGGIAGLPGAPLPPERARAWRPLFSYPLAVALALFLLARWPERSRQLPLLLLLTLLLPPQTVEAAETAWHAPMRAGFAAWKQRDYGAATRQFSAALLLAGNERERADALYNLGNAHYGLGHWQIAAEAWRAVLVPRPGDTGAAGNLIQAETQLKKHRDAPMPSDLRGRRGALAEGLINTEQDRESQIEELAPTPTGPQNEAARASEGARLGGGQRQGRGIEADARVLQSGLKKLDLLDDRPRDLLRAQLKQDTPPDARPVATPPW